jgi:hypothetical protein
MEGGCGGDIDAGGTDVHRSCQNPHHIFQRSVGALSLTRSKTSGAEPLFGRYAQELHIDSINALFYTNITAVHGMVGVQCSNAYLERLRSKWLDAELLFRCRSGAEQRLELIN